MQGKLLEEIRIALQEKEANLSAWLQETDQEEKQLVLGPAGADDINAQLETIETALEELEEGTLGVCDVCHSKVDPGLLQMDYTSCICLEHYSAEERSRLEDDLGLSQDIQRAMLPQNIPLVPGFEIAAFSRPAQIVSGDYFDFVEFKDKSHGLVVADVSGHGISAGMLMSSLQTAFQTLSPEAGSPTEVLERLNHLYIHNIKLTTFVTVFFGKIEPQTRTLYYTNAGHPAYLYRQATGQDFWLPRTAPAIGLVEDFQAGLEKLPLQTGDVLVLYTDGITESISPDGRQFGDAALAQVVRGNQAASAQKLVGEIMTALGAHTAGSPNDDDITLLVYKTL